MNRQKSESLFSQAKKFIPGGVNSPVRAFNAVGGNPLFIQEASGVRIKDADGNTYIDYVGSWGPLIHGHAHPKIVEAISKVAEKGTSFGAPTELEIQLAEKVVNAVPSIEIVRMVNSGTEATMSAIRLARGFTGRDKIVKFEGCYHGHGDSLLVKSGSGLMSLGIPDCPGIVADLANNTYTLDYNNFEQVTDFFAEKGKEMACLIVEPIAGNMGVIPPKTGFLELLRKVTSENDCLLIFDEVISGFRVSMGGAQELYGIQPDLTCLGKTIGGGLPVGAYGGKKEIMNEIAPLGNVYQAGTLSGNPLAMVAGIETLSLLEQPGTYEELDRKSEKLCQGLKENVGKLGINAQFSRVGSMFSMFFAETEIMDYNSVKTCNTDMFKKYFNGLLERGIYIAPSQFEAGFMSTIHSDKDIDITLEASLSSLEQAVG